MTGPEASSVTIGRRLVPYAILRSVRRVKTVALTVDHTGQLNVVAPVRISTSRLDAIVQTKAAWVLKRLRQREASGGPSGVPALVSGSSVLYLGRHYRLHVRDSSAIQGTRLRGGDLQVTVRGGESDQDAVRECLHSWLRRRAEVRLPERIRHWTPRVGVPEPRVIVANQKRQWGSCDRRGVVRLNWRIVQAPMSVVDYVVVHELTHLLHGGHGQNFWAGRGAHHAGLQAQEAGATCAREHARAMSGRVIPGRQLSWNIMITNARGGLY